MWAHMAAPRSELFARAARFLHHPAVASVDAATRDAFLLGMGLTPAELALVLADAVPAEHAALYTDVGGASAPLHSNPQELLSPPFAVGHPPPPPVSLVLASALLSGGGWGLLGVAVGFAWQSLDVSRRIQELLDPEAECPVADATTHSGSVSVRIGEAPSTTAPTLSAGVLAASAAAPSVAASAAAAAAAAEDGRYLAEVSEVRARAREAAAQLADLRALLNVSLSIQGAVGTVANDVRTTHGALSSTLTGLTTDVAALRRDLSVLSNDVSLRGGGDSVVPRGSPAGSPASASAALSRSGSLFVSPQRPLGEGGHGGGSPFEGIAPAWLAQQGGDSSTRGVGVAPLGTPRAHSASPHGHGGYDGDERTTGSSGIVDPQQSLISAPKRWAVADAVAALTALNSPAALRYAAPTLLMVLGNLLESPSVPRFRRLPSTNETFRKGIIR